MKSTCFQCGKEYNYTHHNDGTYKHYCCLECREKAKLLKQEEKSKPQKLICQHCGKEYLWENKGNWNENNEQVKTCGKNSSNFVVNSKKYCCYECGKADRREKVRKTNLERYGNEVAMKSEVIKNKLKDSLRNISIEKKEEYIKKRVETRRQKIDEISQNISLGLKKAYQERGQEIQEKVKKTCLDRYGVTSTNKLESMKKKSRETCLEKYGTEYAIQNKEMREKIEKTNLEKYGTKIASCNKEIANKIKDSLCSRTDEEKEFTRLKTIQTNRQKYGTDYPIQSLETKQKVKDTCLKKYGKTTSFDYKQIRQTNLEKYGVEYTCLLDEARKGMKCISKPNKKFYEKLKKVGCECELEFSLIKYAYDIKFDNTLIEIDPTFTHQSTIDITLTNKRIPPKSPTYHQDKSLFALENGYFCLHIWDWDDEDKIIETLKPKKPLYARSLEIKEPSYEEIGLFLEKYHLQGSCYGQEIRLGLYKDDELIQVMTFGKPRYNKTYEYELLRLCTKAGYSVVGGAERLFNHFLNTYNPNSIISYCDNSKFKGDVYKKFGMELKSYGKPSKHWFNPFTFRHITDNLLRQRGYSQLHNDKIHKKGESNELLMLEAGYLEIYDCGQSTFIWKKR